ncbi:PIN domain-containing protein [Haloarcula sp. 1CSR25-25]|jgi:predicted nucleic acid-binding protein|uniref:PIN domain-containing protein n=1 Tax=Haloarcula sp. 1CSR25-25 TaxID=2862545 RepID=UPI002894B074|nr:PIN domain-containing protein [Haloarcula sp. 1CSR25-25]MDT3434618.1 PIN domain-containing protein [Haloarcula sp. 1CSR25-25]
MFLDTSAIIAYQQGDEHVVEYLDDGRPWYTSTICAFEYINGRLGSGETDVLGVRQEFSDVQPLDLNEPIAVEAARLQDELLTDGDRLATTDMLIAATARSTGDELVVADSDFETEILQTVMEVTNLRN